MQFKKINQLTLFLSILLISVLLSGCADQTDVQECLTGHTYGFWGGLWHGMITPLSFIGSLFDSDIAVWAPNNNGGWYSFGFVLGVGGFSLSISRSKK